MKKQTIGTKVEGVVDYVTNQSIRRNTPFRLTKFGDKIYFYEGKEIAEDIFHKIGAGNPIIPKGGGRGMRLPRFKLFNKSSNYFLI